MQEIGPQRLLVLIAIATSATPAEGIDTQNHVTAARKRVADSAATIDPVGPVGDVFGKGRRRVVAGWIARPDQFFLADRKE